MKKLFYTFVVLILSSLSAKAMTLDEQVQWAAIADGVSTYAVIHHPDPGYAGVERNGLAPVNTGGIILLTAVKASIPYLVRNMEKSERVFALKTARSVYAGAAAHNVVSWKAHDRKASVGVGLAVAAALWYFGGEELQVEVQSKSLAEWTPTRVGKAPDVMQDFQ